MNKDFLLQIGIYLVCMTLANQAFATEWVRDGVMILMGLLLVFGDDIQFYLIEKRVHHEDD